jgi:hypothetical protein
VQGKSSPPGILNAYARQISSRLHALESFSALSAAFLRVLCV